MKNVTPRSGYDFFLNLDHVFVQTREIIYDKWLVILAVQLFNASFFGKNEMESRRKKVFFMLLDLFDARVCICVWKREKETFDDFSWFLNTRECRKSNDEASYF